MSFFGKSFIIIFLLVEIHDVFSQESVIETLNKTDNLTLLMAKVKNLSMVDDINKMPKLTIFAPINTGITKLDNKSHVKNILKYHMISEIFNATEFNISNPKRTVTNLLGISLEVSVNGSEIKVANVTLRPEIKANNGSVFPIPTAFETPGDVFSEMAKHTKLSSLSTVLQRMNLHEALKTTESITLFAPNNDVFAKSTDWQKFLNSNDTENLKKFVQHHFTSKERLTSLNFDSDISKNLTMDDGKQIQLSKNNKILAVNGIKISGTEIHCINGIIYVIDKFLIDPKSFEKPPKESISSKHQYNMLILFISSIFINGFF